MIALLLNCIITRRMKGSPPNGWTYIFVLKHRANFQALCDKESKAWRYGWMVRSQMEVNVVSGLSYRISGLVWRRGEGQDGHCSYPNPPSTSITMFLWSFLTIDSSLNNHYSQLDMKWVDPAGPLIARSISDHKIPEGSISIKSVPLTESHST